MKPNQQAFVRQDRSYSDGFVQQPLYGFAPPQQPYQGYPGLFNNSYGGYDAAPAASTSLTAPTAAASSGFSFTQLKGIVDRMGGIEGLMGHVTRIQKIIQSLQQMSPMLKLLLGSFGGAKATTADMGRERAGGANRNRRRSSATPKRNVNKTLSKRRTR